MARYNILEIAECFLSKESMTHKKLQFMCYYADVLCLALYDEKMLEGNFEAWIHGPANRKLFNKYKDNGRAIISIDLEKQLENKKYQKIIDFTWDIYGNFTGDELESYAKSYDIAYKEAREGFKDFEPCKRLIKINKMKEEGEKNLALL